MAWFRRFHCLWWIATKQYRQCGLFSWNKKGGYCFLHCCCCRCCCCNCGESVTTYADARYGSGMCHQRNFKQQQKKVVRWNAWLYFQPPGSSSVNGTFSLASPGAQPLLTSLQVQSVTRRARQSRRHLPSSCVKHVGQINYIRCAAAGCQYKSH